MGFGFKSRGVHLGKKSSGLRKQSGAFLIYSTLHRHGPGPGSGAKLSQVTFSSSAAGQLTLGNIFDAAGVDSSQVLLLRHTYSADGLTGPSDLTPEKIHEYVRLQGINNKVGRNPPFIWMNFIATGGRRSRFLGAYENHGEMVHQRTPTLRCFDLRPAHFLASLQGRLVVEWSKDAVNWAKSAKDAINFPITEISDPQPKPFPGFDQLLLSFRELQSVVEDSHYDR